MEGKLFPACTRNAASLVHTKKLHIIQQRDVGLKVHERTSAVTGLPILAVREETDVSEEVYIDHYQFSKRRKSLVGASETIRAKQVRLRDEGFIEARKQTRMSEHTQKWRTDVSLKWSALHTLHKIRSRPEHRFAMNLENVFRQGCPYFHIERSLLIRLYLSNFAFDRDARKESELALQQIFAALDENFDDLVDWRDFLGHLLIMELPKQPLHSKLEGFFRLYSDSNQKEIALAYLWQIVRTFSLGYQRPVIAELFLARFDQFGPFHLSQSWEDFHVKPGQSLDFLANVKPNKTRNRDVLDVNIHGLSGVEQATEEERRIAIGQYKIDHESFQTILIGARGGDNDLFTLMKKLLWDRQPDFVRLTLTKAREDASSKRFEFINTKIRWLEAKQWWQTYIMPNVLQKRFNHWKEIATYRINKRNGYKYWYYRRIRTAFNTLGLYAEEKVFDRWRNDAADRFAKRVIKADTMRKWKDFHRIQQRVFLIQVKRAKRLYDSFQMETCLKTWRKNVGILKKLREISTKWKNNGKREHFETWRDNVQTIRALRSQEEAEIDARQQVLEQEIKETEAMIEQMRQQEMEEETRRLEMEQRQREAEILEKQRWEMEREKAYQATERRTILKKQEQERQEKKSAHLQKEQQEFDVTFAEVEKNAVDQAKAEAETFLGTAAGRLQMKLEAEAIMHDSEKMKMGNNDMENQEGSDWKKMFDPVLESYFFYNSATGEKVPAISISKDEALNIAKANYIANMVQIAKKEVQTLKDKELEQKMLIWAGRKLQSAFRTRRARRLLNDMVKTVYIKRVDAYTGKMYYYNMRMRKAAWTKPLTLGKHDLKPPEWAIRCDADGKWFYENRYTPWLTSHEKPAGFLPCQMCNLQLHWIVCNTCSQHYCLDCFEEYHPLNSAELRTHQVDKKPYEELVKNPPETCLMCKSTTASHLCKECGISAFYCGRCYNMSHKPNPKKPGRLTAKQRHAPSITF